MRLLLFLLFPVPAPACLLLNESMFFVALYIHNEEFNHQTVNHKPFGLVCLKCVLDSLWLCVELVFYIGFWQWFRWLGYKKNKKENKERKQDEGKVVFPYIYKIEG